VFRKKRSSASNPPARCNRNWKSIRPVSGYITERNALPSVAVQPEIRLYTIADLSTVWVQAQVFQNDLERIKVGAPATLTVNTYPGRTFTGRVDFIYPQVDMDTRTAKVRVVFRILDSNSNRECSST